MGYCPNLRERLTYDLIVWHPNCPFPLSFPFSESEVQSHYSSNDIQNELCNCSCRFKCTVGVHNQLSPFVIGFASNGSLSVSGMYGSKVQEEISMGPSSSSGS